MKKILITFISIIVLFISGCSDHSPDLADNDNSASSDNTYSENDIAIASPVADTDNSVLSDNTGSEDDITENLNTDLSDSDVKEDDLLSPPFSSRTLEKLDDKWNENDISTAWQMTVASNVYAEYTDRVFCDIDNDLSAELLLTSYSTQDMYFFKKTDDNVELLFELIDIDITNGYMFIPPTDKEIIQKCEVYDYQDCREFKLYNKSGDIYVSGISWRPSVGLTCWIKNLTVSNDNLSFCDVFRWGMFTANDRIASKFEYRKYDYDGSYSYTTQQEIDDFLLFLKEGAE